MTIDLTRTVGPFGRGLGIEEGPRYDDIPFEHLACQRITFIPHAHCTHAESIEHLKGTKGSTTWELLSKLPGRMSARLWSSASTEACDMLIVKKEDINGALISSARSLRVLATDAVSLDWTGDPNVPLHRALFSKFPECILIELLSDAIYDLQDDGRLYTATVVGFPFVSDGIPVRVLLE